MTRSHALRLIDRISPVLSIAGALALWQLVTTTGVVDERYLPTMTDTVSTLYDLVGGDAFWTSVADTLQATALGLAIAAGLAIPLGLLIGASELMYRATRVLVEFLRPIPSVALIPLAVLVYGIGMPSAVFLAAFAAFWPLLVQTFYGMHDVDPVAVDTARSFGLGRLTRLRRVELPSALPFIATGARISVTVALILVITAQLVIGVPGLGRDITVAQSGGDVPATYALVLATGLLGWVLNTLTSAIERRALRWHPSQRRTA